MDVEILTRLYLVEKQNACSYKALYYLMARLNPVGIKPNTAKNTQHSLLCDAKSHRVFT